MKKEATQAQKKKSSENRKLIFKRAEQYVKEYSDKEKVVVGKLMLTREIFRSMGYDFKADRREKICSSRGRPAQTESDGISMSDPKKQQEVVFRLLCSNDTVGSVIDKGGTIVTALQDETGVTISVGSSVSDADERVITVSAKENPESRYSPAQKAVVRVFTRCGGWPSKRCGCRFEQGCICVCTSSNNNKRSW